MFIEYLNNVTVNRSNNKRISLVESLESQKLERKFPSVPGRYVHTFSSVLLNKFQLEVLSLGPKFSDYAPKVDQLDTGIQFENLYSQTSDLNPSSDDELTRFKTALVDSCQ
uniref:Uncharacterized protein n=1 Tax=Trichobilharzia regenti TaxID=157069 RepID=A0AA85JDB6_TRIRE|nr:unnamed protein product [Trichobilharzia regenti]